MLPRLAVTFALAVFVCRAPLLAQAPQPQIDDVAPAHVSHVDGAVSLEREGRSDASPLNMPLLSGDRLRTGEGRAEVLFADGSTLHLDARSTLDVQSDDLLRLTAGRVRLNILGPSRAVAYRIDSPAGSARIGEPGEYRIALLRPSSSPADGGDEAQLELAVVRGSAEIFTDQGATPVRAGERAYASLDRLPSYAYAFNSASWDAFDRWSEARRDVRLGVSSQYLPSDMQSYAPLLDESGDWRYTPSYGYAWYPRVAVDWRPYYYGRWASYPRYGWTWIGADRFAWPTHHYGRWGFSAGAWFWIPSSRWAPANVSWAYAPGYVSWCPLGFDNRPVFGIDIYRAGAGYYSPWRAWTAVSYTHFGSRDYWVNQRAVNWDRVGGPRPHFAARASAPGAARDVAVPRNAAPISWAGSRNVTPQGRADVRSSAGASPTGLAVPRTGAAPRYINRGDDILRSPAARPEPRAGAGVSPGAEARTIPEGPVRQSRPNINRAYDPQPAAARPSTPATERQDRAFDPGQTRPRAAGSGGVQNPAYQPSYQPSYQPPVREAAPADGTPDRQRAYDRPRPGGIQQTPTPSRQPDRERAAPGPAPRGPGSDAAPSRGETRQPPPQRAAPPPSRATGPDRAAPRVGRGGL